MLPGTKTTPDGPRSFFEFWGVGLSVVWGLCACFGDYRFAQGFLNYSPGCPSPLRPSSYLICSRRLADGCVSSFRGLRPVPFRRLAVGLLLSPFGSHRSAPGFSDFRLSLGFCSVPIQL